MIVSPPEELLVIVPVFWTPRTPPWMSWSCSIANVPWFSNLPDR